MLVGVTAHEKAARTFDQKLHLDGGAGQPHLVMQHRNVLLLWQIQHAQHPVLRRPLPFGNTETGIQRRLEIWRGKNRQHMIVQERFGFLRQSS